MARPHGTKYIETPEKMWELFEEYRTLTKQSPRYRTQFVGRDGVMVKEPLERPLTLEGFSNYCYQQNVINSVESYFINQNGAYNDYLGVCSRIRSIIRQDQIEGGMVGQYNPSITQRLNGLVEKSENKTEHSGTINANFGNPIQSTPKAEDNT
jgi:hypothetical protein